MRSAAVLAATAVSLMLAGRGAASWSIHGTGNGSAKARSLVGNKPSASTTTGGPTVIVTLTWAATPGASGYVITRTGGTGNLGGTCVGLLSATSCTDPVLPLQTYTYTVTPTAGLWVGTPSPSVMVNT
jgi:hypothetical protein